MMVFNFTCPHGLQEGACPRCLVAARAKPPLTLGPDVPRKLKRDFLGEVIPPALAELALGGPRVAGFPLDDAKENPTLRHSPARLAPGLELVTAGWTPSLFRERLEKVVREVPGRAALESVTGLLARGGRRLPEREPSKMEDAADL
ncbi:MAG: hypothetical protein Kow0069_27830 [Promethearchaeota archaeon]